MKELGSEAARSDVLDDVRLKPFMVRGLGAIRLDSAVQKQMGRHTVGREGVAEETTVMIGDLGERLGYFYNYESDMGTSG